jgi:ATP-dependent Clp protease ATP-binding subunit ClpC
MSTDDGTSMFDRFTDRARRVVVLSQEEARAHNHDYIGTEHILLGLIHEGQGVAARALEALDIPLEILRQQVEEVIGQGSQLPAGFIPFTPRAKKVLELALREALLLSHNYMGTEHILLGLIREGEGVAAQVLVRLGADLDRVRQQVIQLLAGFAAATAEAAPATSPALGQFCRNLTQAAREGKLDPVFGRRKETERVMQVLSRRARNKPVLIGEPGVGKTAVVEGLARAIAEGAVPEMLQTRSLYVLDLGAIIAGESGSGVAEERLGKVFAEVQASGAVLFIDELCAVVKGGIGDAIGCASLLKSALIYGDLCFVGTATRDEYSAYIESDAALARSLQPIPVDAPSVADAVEMLKGVRDRYEAHHRVSITDSALVAAATAGDEYVADRVLPGSAVALIDEASALVRVRWAAGPPDLPELDEEIAVLRRNKEAAIDAQDFGKAAALRDQERAVLAAKAEREKEWKDAVLEVDEHLISEACAELRPQPGRKRVRRPRPTLSPAAAAILVAADAEIWGML